MDASFRPQRSSASQFGRLAEIYSNSKTHSRATGLSSAAAFLSQRQYDLAVDIGAGPGFTAFDVAKQCDRVIATDVTPEMLEQVRLLRGERGAPNTEMMLVTSDALPYANASIDLVTCRTAAHHFLDVPTWLDEVFRILKTNGELILIDTVSPNDPEASSWMHEIEIWRDPSHARNLTVDQWENTATRSGFTVDETSMSRVELEFPDWAERAGMEASAAQSLGDALRSAPPAAKEAFDIRVGRDETIDFYWPILAMKAHKA